MGKARLQMFLLKRIMAKLEQFLEVSEIVFGV